MAKKKETTDSAAELLKQAIVAIDGDDNESAMARDSARRALKWLERKDQKEATPAE